MASKGKSFLDDKADESEEEDEEVPVRRGKQSRKSAAGKQGNSDSSEEDEDEPNEYEKDDFLVDGDEEEVDEDPEERRRQREKRRREEMEFAEGDLQLLQDAGVRLKKTKKLTRLKREKGMDDEDDEDEDEDEDALFGEDEPESNRLVEDEVDDDDEDEMDDFLDDGGRRGARRKKKKSARDGFKGSAVREAEEIFGDEEDLQNYTGAGDYFLARPDDEEDVAPRKTREEEEPTNLGKAQMELALDPSVMDDEFMTQADEQIRNVDFPEFIQLHFANRKRLPEDELSEEAEWIQRYGFVGGTFEDQNVSTVTDKILILLRFLHLEALDIPFIATYRKEYIAPELIRKAPISYTDHPSQWNSPAHAAAIDWSARDDDWSYIWAVVDWDKRYAQMQARRQSVEETLDQAEQQHVDANIVANARDEITTCEREEDLADWDRLTRRYLAIAEANRELQGASAETRQMRPSRRDRYLINYKMGLGSLAEKFGITADQLAENMSALTHTHVSQDETDPPSNCASTWLDEHPSSFGGPPDPDLSEEEREQINERRVVRALDAARFMAVSEISTSPGVRRYFRDYARRDLTLTTKPTSKGKEDVGDFHPLRPFISVGQIKMSDLRDTYHFLMMEHAERLGYCTIGMHLFYNTDEASRAGKSAELTDGEDIDRENAVHERKVQSLPTEYINMYLSKGTSFFAESWNKERRQVLVQAADIVIPAVVQDMRRELVDAGQSVLKELVGRCLDLRLDVGPLSLQGETASGILAFSVSGEDENPELASGSRPRGTRPGPVIHAASIDSDGEVVDVIEIPGNFLTRRRNDPVPGDVQRQLTDLFAWLHPRAVVIGAGHGGKHIVTLYEDIKYVLVRWNPKDGAEESGDEGKNDGRKTMTELERAMQKFEESLYGNDPKLSSNRMPKYELGENDEDFDSFKKRREHHLASRLIYVEDEAAHLYSTSATCKRQHPEYSALQRRAIGLARYAQEPLAVTSTVGLDREGAVSFQMHQDQHLLPPEVRRECFRRALVRAVNGVGVDINRALAHPHLRSMVSFIGGLGPRKAKALIKELEKEQTNPKSRLVLESRKELVLRKLVLPRVFVSSAGFIRIRDTESRRSRKSKGSPHHPLDDTRIHPEAYPVAIKIAEDAFEISEPVPAAEIVSRAMKSPGALADLDLDIYAQHIQSQGRGKMLMIMKLILSEYASAFGEHRQNLESPPADVLFFIACETDRSSVVRGKLVAATGCRISGAGVSCFVGNIRAFVPRPEIADEDLSEDELRRMFASISEMSCRIKEIDFQSMEIKLTGRKEVITDVKNMGIGFYEEPPYLADKFSALSIQPIKSEQKKDGQPSTSKRFVMKDVARHPLFVNGNSADAKQRLRKPGDCVIYPHKQKKHFSISLRVSDAAPVITIVVKDEGSTHEQRYAIDTGGGGDWERFGDVDEIIGRYAEPLMNNYGEISDSRKFFSGDEESMKGFCRSEREKSSQGIPYCIGYSRKSPGYGVLAYLPSKHSVRMEYFRVLADGYRLRRQTHKKLSHMLDWWKRHWRELLDKPKVSEGLIRAPAPATMQQEPPMPPSSGMLGAGARPDMQPPPTAPPVLSGVPVAALAATGALNGNGPGMWSGRGMSEGWGAQRTDSQPPLVYTPRSRAAMEAPNYVPSERDQGFGQPPPRKPPGSSNGPSWRNAAPVPAWMNKK